VLRRRSTSSTSAAWSARRRPTRGIFTLPKSKIDCTGPGPDCAVKTSASASIAGASARRRRVKLGGSSFKVKTGKTGRVRVKLTRKGLRLLKRRKRIKAKVAITVKRGSVSAKKTVTVTLRAPKRAKRGR